MTRIFLMLAGLSLLLLCANIVLGLRIGDYNGKFTQQATLNESVDELEQKIEELKQQRPRPVEQIDELRQQRQTKLNVGGDEFAKIQSRKTTHMMFGVVAALVTLLVNSISVTYFIGTSRWVREVVETYDFPAELIAESNAIKRSTFPWALLGMLTIVGIIALGQACNPATFREGTANWVTPHLLGAMAGTALIGFAFFRQGNNIAKNYALIDRVVSMVEKVRQAKGLHEGEGNADSSPEKPAKPKYHGTVTG